jgi:hypothetical protein
MALSPEQTQTLETLRFFNHKELFTVARDLIDTHASTQNLTSATYFSGDGLLQLGWGIEEIRPTLVEVGGHPEAAPIIVERLHHERLAINLSREALYLSIDHTDVPVELLGVEDTTMYEYQRVTFMAQSQRIPKVLAVDRAGRPLDGREKFLPRDFARLFFHTTAKLGLYTQASTKSVELQSVS